MAEIVWLDRALDMLDESLEFIAEDSQSAAENLALRVTSKIERLEIFPLSGKKPIEKLNPAYLEIVIKPFRIFYTFDEVKDTIFIKEVFSSKQDIYSHLAGQSETAYLMESKANAEMLEKSMDQLEKGET